MTPHFETGSAIPTGPVEPPPFCDLAWHSAGGAIFTAEPTPLYEAAVTRAMGGMERVGFDLRADRVTLDMSRCRDTAKFEQQLAIWTRIARAQLVEEEERAAARTPLAGEAIAEVQDGLSRLLDEAEWAFNKRGNLARQFAQALTLTRRQFDWARDILSGARSAVAAVVARLLTEAGADAMERAYDADGLLGLGRQRAFDQLHRRRQGVPAVPERVLAPALLQGIREFPTCRGRAGPGSP